MWAVKGDSPSPFPYTFLSPYLCGYPLEAQKRGVDLSQVTPPATPTYAPPDFGACWHVNSQDAVNEGG